MKMATCRLCLSWWVCPNRIQQRPGWSEYTILWHLNAQLHFFFCCGSFFVAETLTIWAILSWKWKKSCNPGLIQEERFGTGYNWKANPPLPVTCFSGRVSWTLMTTNIPESSAPGTAHTSSLQDRIIFCLETDKKNKRMRHVSVKSAVFASSPVPSIFSYLPARAVRWVVRRPNPANKSLQWL